MFGLGERDKICCKTIEVINLPTPNTSIQDGKMVLTEAENPVYSDDHCFLWDKMDTRYQEMIGYYKKFNKGEKGRYEIKVGLSKKEILNREIV